MLFEKLLIAHCSPTLASLKIANLFSCPFTTEQELSDCVQYWNEQMKKTGICLEILRQGRRHALIYVFRSSELKERLEDRAVVRFLGAYGYKNMDLSSALKHLKERLQENSEFPHEIGIFLGYPLEDVIGFIDNHGKNFQVSGLWKVYGDKEKAVQQFGRYKKCTDLYLRLWNHGKSVRQLTVAA
mgnify:CR=1 FL=1